VVGWTTETTRATAGGSRVGFSAAMNQQQLSRSSQFEGGQSSGGHQQSRRFDGRSVPNQQQLSRTSQFGGGQDGGGMEDGGAQSYGGHQGSGRFGAALSSSIPRDLLSLTVGCLL
jgi:hypothetical protein